MVTAPRWRGDAWILEKGISGNMDSQDKQGSDSPLIVPRRRGRPAAGGRQATGNGASGSVQSLSRAFALLRLLAAHPTGISLSDAAQKLSLAPSTAHRLLTAMANERFVRHDNERSLWFVGVEAFRTGNAFLEDRDFVAIARPVMRNLMEQAQESVNFAVMDQDAVLYLSQVECRALMRALAYPGARAPLHCSGVGKALLAAMPENEAAAIVGRIELPALTERTLTSRQALLDDLQATRERGFSYDDEEQAVGMRCVAAAVFDEHGWPMAALSLSGPSARMDDGRIPKLGLLVSDHAREITELVGGRRPADTG